MKKKLFSVMLCIAMVIVMIPFSAAESNNDIRGSSSGMPFQDLEESSWYYDAVSSVYEKGYMNGISNVEFVPSGTLTRGMFVTILGRVDGIDSAAYTGTHFSDVNAGAWFTPYIEWAYQKGVTNGIGGSRFGPDDAVTREEMAAFIYRYTQLTGIELPKADNPVESFEDSKEAADWAKEGLELMRTSGLIIGDGEGFFNPGSNATRAQAAMVFMRLESSFDTISEMHNTFVVYFSGNDTRSDTLDTSRSDTNLILLLDPEEKQMLILNTPRDYYLANPAGNEAMDKLSQCGEQGVENSVEVLSRLYDLDIDYWAQINFVGFRNLINTIGGITVYSDMDFSISGYQFHQGMNEMNGAQALAFCRERKSFTDGDETRGRHQMWMLKAIFQKVADNPSMLLRYGEIVSSLKDTFITNLGVEEYMQVIRMRLDNLDSWNIRCFAVSGSDGDEITWTRQDITQYVMYPDESKVKRAKHLIKMLKTGQTITAGDVEMNTEYGTISM